MWVGRLHNEEWGFFFFFNCVNIFGKYNYNNMSTFSADIYFKVDLLETAVTLLRAVGPTRTKDKG